MIVGLTGKARSGKDTAADILVAEYGYAKVAFAAEVKAIAMKHFGLTHKEVFLEKTEFSRRILQGIGDGFREEVNKKIWIEKVLSDDNKGKLIVIPDVRYLNEVEEIRKFGGVVFKVVRDDRPAIEYNADHISEMEQDGIEPDAMLFNGSTPEKYRDVVRSTFEMFNDLWRKKV